MRIIPRILTLFCLSTLAVSHVWAQVYPGAPTGRSADKVVVRNKYDPLKNVTAVVIDPYMMIDNGHFAFTAGFTYSGKTLRSPPESVELGIVSQSRSSWQFDNAKARELKVVVDGDQVFLGTVDRVEFRTLPFNSIFTDRTELYFEEKLAIFIPYDAFQKMVDGKKVVMKLGGYDSKLSKHNLELVRELASKMKP